MGWCSTPEPDSASGVTNAFAVGGHHDAAVAVTHGMLRNLTGREVAAVLAHEIAHVKAGDTNVMSFSDTLSQLVQNLSWLLGIFTFAFAVPATAAEESQLLVIAILLTTLPTATTMLQLALNRSREYDADLEGALPHRRPLATCRPDCSTRWWCAPTPRPWSAPPGSAPSSRPTSNASATPGNWHPPATPWPSGLHAAFAGPSPAPAGGSPPRPSDPPRPTRLAPTMVGSARPRSDELVPVVPSPARPPNAGDKPGRPHRGQPRLGRLCQGGQDRPSVEGRIGQNACGTRPGNPGAFEPTRMRQHKWPGSFDGAPGEPPTRWRGHRGPRPH